MTEQEQILPPNPTAEQHTHTKEQLAGMKQSEQLTEHEKRLKRAARFGLDPTQVIGPSPQQAALSNINLRVAAQGAKTRLTEQIEKIKYRQDKFCEEPMPQADEKIEKLSTRINKLHNTAKPEPIQSDAIVIADKLYLYGTDYMSTGEIKNYFVHFPSIQVKWINDSSCIIQFATDEEATDAFYKHTVKALTEEQQQAKDEQEAEQQDEAAMEVDQRNYDEKIGWREALAYQHDLKGWQTLWLRFATDQDTKKDDTKGQDSRFYKFKENQRQRNKPNQSKYDRNNNSKSSFVKKTITKDDRYKRTTKDIENESVQSKKSDERKDQQIDQASEKAEDQENMVRDNLIEMPEFQQIAENVELVVDDNLF